MNSGAHTWPTAPGFFGGANLKEIEEEDPTIPEENVLQSLSKLQVSNAAPINHVEPNAQPDAQVGFAIFRYLGPNAFGASVQN